MFPYNVLFSGIEKSVQTGMSHGYWIVNLDKMFHPTADEAFERWRDVFSDTGFTEEAVVVDDYGHFHIIREPLGAVCDVSGRFRSWESGVMGHALLFHLTGYDAHVGEGFLKLAPHLPPEWDRVAFTGMAYGEGRIDVEVEETSEGRVVTVTTDDAPAFDLLLTVPVDGEISGVTLNGETLGQGEYTAAANAYGRKVVTLDPIAVSAGETVQVVVQRTSL